MPAVCSEAADKLCRDASHLVKVPALASLGQLLPLLPAADAAAAKPPLLALLASTAKPPATIAGVRECDFCAQPACMRCCVVNVCVHENNMVVCMCMCCNLCCASLYFMCLYVMDH